MKKATRKTYELLTEFYIGRDMEVELYDDPLLESLGINFDEFKDYVKESKMILRRHTAMSEMILREQRNKLDREVSDDE